MYEAKVKISSEMLMQAFPAVNKLRGLANKQANIKGFVYTYNKYADYFAIDTTLEARHFISQIAHESDSFNAFEEYASGDAYDTRTDLGNTPQKDGDGRLYKGRGPLQTTGAKNYEIAGEEILKLPFLTPSEKKLFENKGILKNPKLLQDPVWGTLAAFIYWTQKDLNSLCQEENKLVTIKRFNGTKWYNYTCGPIEAITRKINGGVNGLQDRINKFRILKKFF